MIQHTDFLKLLEDTHGKSKEEQENHFLDIATKLISDFCIISGGEKYKIVECEIYYFNPSNHADVYSHKHEHQLAPGQWYFHGSGIDITFGKKGTDDKNHIYGGILIRGIKDLSNDKYISGPLKVVTEIFKSSDIFEPRTFYLANIDFKEKDTEIFQSTRVGLNPNKENGDIFCNSLYRYVSEINSNHAFKEKTKVASEMNKSGKYDRQSIIQKFGYEILAD